MKKFISITLFIPLTAIIAGIYGIIHDQITFSISAEYFTKFKYVQFGINPDEFGGDRVSVAIIGFMATWWVGLFIGIILGLLSLILNHLQLIKQFFKLALLITFSVAVFTSFIGFLYGKYRLTETGVDWWLPENLVDKDHFIIVGSIHNFSYLGGILGMLLSIIYLFVLKNNSRSLSPISNIH